MRYPTAMAYYYSPFRNTYNKDRAARPGCVFCDPTVLAGGGVRRADGTVVENEHYLWIINSFPKFEGHTLIVPKRHVTELGDETPAEVAAREELVVLASRALQTLYPGAGVEVFLQTGPGSESSVSHLHWHVTPAQPDDPLRGFDKLGQFFTIEPDKERVIIFPVPIKLAQDELLAALAKVLT